MEIMAPRDLAAQQGTLDKNVEPFSVRLKQFWDVRETRRILEKFVPKITHENDGLIFNPLDEVSICLIPRPDMCKPV
jgi:mRNA-capping enzyme